MGKKRKVVYEGHSSFLYDLEKMHDFITLNMDEFLFTYSYLTEEDYYATYDHLMDLVSFASALDSETLDGYFDRCAVGFDEYENAIEYPMV